jgi:hypothetical protein
MNIDNRKKRTAKAVCSRRVKCFLTVAVYLFPSKKLSYSQLEGKRGEDNSKNPDVTTVQYSVTDSELKGSRPLARAVLSVLWSPIDSVGITPSAILYAALGIKFPRTNKRI